MDRERLQRKLLFGWVDHPRKTGGQTLTFGRRLERTVKAAIKVASPDVRRKIEQPDVGWIKFAKDRDEWRNFVYNSL